MQPFCRIKFSFFSGTNNDSKMGDEFPEMGNFFFSFKKQTSNVLSSWNMFSFEHLV